MNHKKVIGFLRNTFLPPSETFIYSQLRMIDDFQVEVLTRKYVNRELFPYPRVNAIIQNGGIGQWADFFPYTLFLRSKFLEKVIKEKKISLIHAHFGIEGVYGLRMKRKFKIPLLTTFYGHDITKLPRLTVRKIAWLNYYLHFSQLKEEGDFFIANSEFIKEKLLEKGFSPRKIGVNYLGIDTKEFSFSASRNRRELFILTAGRLVEKKGIDYLIRAFEKISRSFQNLKLLIIGEGPLRKYLGTTAQKLGLVNRVVFLGRKTPQEVAYWMKKAYIFSLPSVTTKQGDTEGIPTVILEASACGKPVVSTWHAGIPEAVIDKETGFLVPEKDIDGLAEKLRFLVEDGELREKMGKRGRELVKEKFDIWQQGRKLEKIYHLFL